MPARPAPIFAPLVFLTLTASCAPPPAPRAVASPVPTEASSNDELPPSSATYGSDPTPGGAIGGPTSTKMARHVARALRDRGDDAKPDGRLALLASWALHRAARGIATDASATDAVARRLGYVGPTPWVLTFRATGDLDASDVDADLRRHTDAFPRNVVLTRYGVATIGRGSVDLVAVAVGSVELSLGSVPKRAAVNDVVQLTGSLSERFAKGRLSITLPGGSVKTWDSSGRDVTAPIQLVEKGVHRLELFGDGETGPVVVANFPVYVGVDEPAPEISDAVAERTDRAATLAGPKVEARMLVLLNAARADAHLAPLVVDSGLAALALAHSQDMVDHAFVGHVSPSTGTPEDRARRAHLLLPLFGENVSRASSAEEAHRGLMDSPGHRANMLSADFTHVGIGAVVVPARDGTSAGVVATLEFARRRPIVLADVPARVLDQLQVARLTSGRVALHADDALSRAAGEASVILAESGDATARAMEAAKASLTRDRKVLAATCAMIVTAPDVWSVPVPAVAYYPHAARAGVAAVPMQDGPESFRLVLLLEAERGYAMPCE